ncbi:hypothetical protein HDU97_009055 [Phlyctochytrium planicorne]|nr:hypothetical protein HDU97_009055 [Phlyctochytrium planicorne]
MAMPVDFQVANHSNKNSYVGFPNNIFAGLGSLTTTFSSARCNGIYQGTCMIKIDGVALNDAIFVCSSSQDCGGVVCTGETSGVHECYLAGKQVSLAVSGDLAKSGSSNYDAWIKGMI